MAQTPIVFDRALVDARRRRALRLGPATFLLDHVADEMSDRLAAVARRFAIAIDLGTPTDAVRRVLLARNAVGVVAAARRDGASRIERGPAVAADEEALPLREGSVDLVVSALALQFV